MTIQNLLHKTVSSVFLLSLLGTLVSCSKSGGSFASSNSSGSVNVQRTSASVGRKPSSELGNPNPRVLAYFPKATPKVTESSDLLSEIRAVRGVLEDLLQVLEQKNGLYPECEASETAQILVEQYIVQDKVFANDETAGSVPNLKSRLSELRAIEEDISLRLFYEPSCQALGEDTLGPRDQSLSN